MAFLLPVVPLKSMDLLKKIDFNLYEKISPSVAIEEVSIKKLNLSSKEKEVLKLAEVGKTNAKISKELYLSIGTVKWYLNQIYSKLYVKNRTQAITKAKSLGEL